MTHRFMGILQERPKQLEVVVKALLVPVQWSTSNILQPEEFDLEIQWQRLPDETGLHKNKNL